MTVQEWRDQNPETGYFINYAADAGSFGRKGATVYGSREVTGRMEVIRVGSRFIAVPEPHDVPVLFVWDPFVCHCPRPDPEEVEV